MKISVLMPCYNGASYLKSAIKSILGQTFFNFQFIIIDDGSTDNTEEIISLFKDERILYKKKEHTGLSDSLNYGLKIVQTELVARMDADDIADRTRLNTQYNFISNNPGYDIIGSNIYIINNFNKILFKLDYPEKDLEIKKNLLVNSVIPHPSVLMKKNVFEKVGYYKYGDDSIQDYYLWLHAIDKVRFYNIQKYLYYYRKNDDSMTGSLEKFRLDRIKVYKMMEKFMAENEKLNFVTDVEKDKLNSKFLIRYSPHIELKKIQTKQNLSFLWKLYYIAICSVPFKLRTLYFFYNPKKRLFFFLNNLFTSNSKLLESDT